MVEFGATFLKRRAHPTDSPFLSPLQRVCLSFSTSSVGLVKLSKEEEAWLEDKK